MSTNTLHEPEVNLHEPEVNLKDLFGAFVLAFWPVSLIAALLELLFYGGDARDHGQPGHCVSGGLDRRHETPGGPAPQERSHVMLSRYFFLQDEM